MGLNFDAAARERIYRRMDRIIVIDQEVLALRTERQRLVRKNEEDEWISQAHRWRGKVVSLNEWRNRARFKITRKPTIHAA